MSVGEVTIVLSRNDSCGFGFSLLGHPGLPPIIYDILEDSPAADCGQIEVGDVILSVNECDVSRYNTKEVLKCLRLSSDPVTLKLRRDPFIKSCVQEQLSVMCSDDETNGQHDSSYEHPYYYNSVGDGNGGLDSTFVIDKGGGSNGSHTERPKFEAYMMTGEHILNLSRLQQTAITQYQKTVDSLWNCRVIKVPKSVPNSPTCDVNNSFSPVKNVVNNNFDTKITNQEQSNCDKNSMSYDPDEMNPNSRSPSPPLAPNGERIVWTYNAPVTETKLPLNYQSSTSLPSASPTSPTSISSSVMSDMIPRLHSLNGVNQQNGAGGSGCNADLSMSETILSPDYQDMETIEILNNRELLMDFSDHSDSDSTLLASDSQPISRRMRRSTSPECRDCDYKIIIQVKASDKDLKKKNNESGVNDAQKQGYRELRNNDDDDSLKYCTSPPSEDESDVESLHSFHYSPKAVDIPSAVRLAKRLFMLDGFKKSDVSRHLSKNNEFSRVVAEEYLKYFSFETETLDLSLRKFLNQFCLTGETQERERVLVHFSKRYLDCNPDGTFNSQDAVHTLTCAIMLLNTDLHDLSIGHKMTCSEFVENLTGLNEGADFPKSMLKMLYQAIKSHPIEWPVDDDDQIAFLTNGGTNGGKNNGSQDVNDNDRVNITKKVDLELNGAEVSGSNSSPFVEYKQSYVMRKCCLGASVSFHKRRWKMMFCTLRDLTLYMHKDEKTYQTFCKKNSNQLNHNHVSYLDNNSVVRVHHALASRAEDYTKKQNVFRLQTADRAEYLFQTSDGKELESWIETLNFVAASFSAHPLEPPVSSKNKFERPFLSFGITKLNLKDQLKDHENHVDNLQLEFENHRKNYPDKNAKSRLVLNYAEKEKYLLFEINRYKTYAHLMRARLSHYREFDVSPTDIHENNKIDRNDLNAITVNNNNNNSLIIGNDIKSLSVEEINSTTRRSPPMSQNRYSYQQAMCR